MDGATVGVAYLNALALSYHLVKLMRRVVYLTEVRPLRPGDCVELWAATGRDEDYADLLRQVCQLAGAECRVHWTDAAPPRKAAPPTSAPWRRAAEWLSRRLRVEPGHDGSRPRVVLCGNPRWLDPICHELLLRACRVWWLYDRFAVRSWLRWQAAGVGQLVCDSGPAPQNSLAAEVPDRLDFRGVDLSRAVRRWLSERQAGL